MPAPVIDTARLRMRPLCEADVPALAQAMNAEAVRRALYLGDGIDEYQVWEQIASFTGQWELRGTGQWALERLEDGELVGRAGLHWPHRVDWPACEVGWLLHPEHWGNGYATEAGAAALRYGFEVRDLPEIISFIHLANPGSEAVARRLNMTKVEARAFAWRPDIVHGRWRITRRDWERASP